MKKIALALVLCFITVPTFADKPALPPQKIHKVHKKSPPVEPCLIGDHALTPEPPPAVPEIVSPPVIEAPPIVAIPPVVVPPVVKLPIKACKTCPEEDRVFLTSGHLAIGVGAQAPWASGLIGFRLEFPSTYLGLEPFISLPYGVGLDGMVYVYRGKTVQFYPLSIGFMLNWNYGQKEGIFGANARFLSDQDVNRVIDLRLGVGLQVKVACGVKLTFDWRVSIPDPVKLVSENGVCHQCGNSGSKALDAGNAVGNAFAQSQLLIGVLFN